MVHYYFDSLLPRIPLPVTRQVTANLEKMKLPTMLSGVTGDSSSMGSVVLPHTLIRDVTLFLWVVGPRRQRPIRGTQNEVCRDLNTPKIGSDSLTWTAAGRLHCLHRYGVASSSSTTSSPKQPEPSSPTPASTPDRVRQQAVRFVLLLPKIEHRLKIYFNTLRLHSISVNPSRSSPLRSNNGIRARSTG
jgi:hypothetical protein